MYVPWSDDKSHETEAYQPLYGRMYVPWSDDKSHETVIFVKYFDSTFIVSILNQLNNMIMFTPKLSFEFKENLLYLE